MAVELLHRHRATWQRKPILRALYSDWYQEIHRWLVPGRTLEVGGGTGNLKESMPDVVCTDITGLPWLDVQTDAQYLPFRAESFANMVLFDALHHIENVRLFFDEALRVLMPTGRLVIMDPYISIMSWPVYRFLHSEPVDLARDPLSPPTRDPQRHPFDANQAVTTILFERNRQAFHERYPQFATLAERRLAFFAYPLSGGFDHPSLLPRFLLEPILAVERVLGFLGRALAFRMLVVLEKRRPPARTA